MESWIQGVCSQTCSNSTLTSAATAIQSGCATDISNGNTVAVSYLSLSFSSPQSYYYQVLLISARIFFGSTLKTYVDGIRINR